MKLGSSVNLCRFRRAKGIPGTTVREDMILTWLQADLLSGANASPLSTWPDSGIIGNNASTVGTAPTVKTNGLNGMRTVAFNQSPLAFADILSNKATESFVIFVAKTGTTADTGGVVHFGSPGGTTNNYYALGGTVYTDYGVGTRLTFSVGTNSALTSFHIGAFEVGPSYLAYIKDGTIVGTITNRRGGSLWRTDPSIGINWVGEVAELIVLNKRPTIAQRQQIEGYLAWKWGLTASLSAGHPFKSIAPDSIEFNTEYMVTTPGWTPASMNTCGWYDFDTVSGVAGSGFKIASINDLGGDNITLTQATGTIQPWVGSVLLNGRKFAHFNGGQYLTSSLNAFSGANQGTVIAVLRGDVDPSNLDSQNGWLVSSSDQSIQHYPYSDGVMYSSFGQQSRFSYTRTVSKTVNRWHITTMRSKAGQWDHTIDGTQVFSKTTGTVSFTTFISIGRSEYTSNSGFKGDIAEVILFPSYLTDADRQKVEGYLAWKWGLQANLDPAHAYVNGPP